MSVATPREPLFAEPLPDGHLLRNEGYALGAVIEADVTPFHRRYGVVSEVDHKLARAHEGKLTWNTIIGLATVEDEIAGLRELEEIGESTGIVMDRALVIPNWVTGLPPELRKLAPPGTSFILDGYEEHRAIAQASTIIPCFNDWHIGSPRALQNTLDAIQAGGCSHGVLAQFAWTLPYVEDEVDAVAANVLAIGAVAAHRDRKLFVDSYLDDGVPSQFFDLASWVGYALLEHHVVTTLCGARYATGFGQLVADIPTKCALWLALTEVLAADHPPVSYFYGNTLDATAEMVTGNFAITAAEVSAFTMVERVHKTGTSYMANPATEKIRVPTVSEIADVHAVARRAAAKTDDFGKLITLDAIYPIRDQLVTVGRAFFDNLLGLMVARGVDINDPLQVLLAMRRIPETEIERTCHPGARAEDGSVIPVVPSEISRRAEGMVDAEVREITTRGLTARGRRFVVCSADTHSYGLTIIVDTLRRVGAEVIEAGVDLDPEPLVTVAAENGWPDIAVSAHNGQCVGYARRLSELSADTGATIYIGGRLNTLEGGDAEPVDATDRLIALGVVPCVSVADMLEPRRHHR